VRTAGFEPARGYPQGILSPLRLPVPPRPHIFEHIKLLTNRKIDEDCFESRCRRHVDASYCMVPLCTTSSNVATELWSPPPNLAAPTVYGRSQKDRLKRQDLPRLGRPTLLRTRLAGPPFGPRGCHHLVAKFVKSGHGQMSARCSSADRDPRGQCIIRRPNLLAFSTPGLGEPRE
jgi:hypothetical protein